MSTGEFATAIGGLMATLGIVIGVIAGWGCLFLLGHRVIVGQYPRRDGTLSWLAFSLWFLLLTFGIQVLKLFGVLS